MAWCWHAVRYDCVVVVVVVAVATLFEVKSFVHVAAACYAVLPYHYLRVSCHPHSLEHTLHYLLAAVPLVRMARRTMRRPLVPVVAEGDDP